MKLFKRLMIIQVFAVLFFFYSEGAFSENIPIPPSGPKEFTVFKVEIGDVIRGTGIPNSVSPTKTFDVPVTITPSIAGTGSNIQFDVINGSSSNGTATISANATRTDSGTITVTGGNQTSVGNAGQLKIRARLNGSIECATSSGFSVCAHPNAVQNGPKHLAFDDGTSVGMKIKIKIKSDSGTDSDLDEVYDSEQVSSSFAHTGSMKKIPSYPPIHTSSFMKATTVPPDKHKVGKIGIIEIVDNFGGKGSYSNNQCDIFKCKRCGLNTPAVIPNSGYQIIRYFIKGSGSKIDFKIEKKAHACTVNGYTTKAGPSPTYPLPPVTVNVRP